MSDRHDHSRSKVYKNIKGDDEIPKSRTKNKCHKEGSKTHLDSKTPPLPTRRTSIEELIKKRESLKHELKKIAKHSESDLANKFMSTMADKNWRHSKSDHSRNMQTRRRHITDHEEFSSAKRKNIVKEPSPERNGDCLQVESDDEETLIAKSRQRRKQLLENFNSSCDEKLMQHKTKILNHHKIDSTDANIQDKNISEGETVMKKTTTDMFSETDDFAKKEPENVTQDNTDKNNSQLTDNWDDAEGYYNVRVGDEIDHKRYTIKSILGQGVFSNVVRAQDNVQKGEVAIKIVRNNEIIYKTGLKEIAVLKEIKEADPEGKYHCVTLIRYFMHKNHLCIVLESLYMDMRSVIKKYGKPHGINMKALSSYSRQLFIALRLLKKMGIVHADVKPDNILVNEKKNLLKLCDFGSASKADENEATPYLVSRFYRAPEIILGIPYKHSIDIWSAACTMYEMATGKIMFMGSCNNRMLKCFMDLKGKFSSKVIRKGRFKDQHFNYKNNFLLHKKDEVTGREKMVETCNIVQTRDLHRDLKKYCKNLNETEEKKLLQLKDILDKMFTLDLNHRISVTDCLRHPFIQEEVQK